MTKNWGNGDNLVAIVAPAIHQYKLNLQTSHQNKLLWCEIKFMDMDVKTISAVATGVFPSEKEFITAVWVV